MTLERLDTVIAFAVVMLGASLLITILTQMAATFFGYRGTNLKWGLKTLLEATDSRLKGQAETLAEQILTHPLISDSWFSRHPNWILVRRWKLATAIRFDEFLGMTQQIAAGGTAPVLGQVLQKVDPQAASKIQALASTLQGLAPAQAAQADQLVQQIAATAQRSVGQMESWFQGMMDRAAQRFAVQMRAWTVVFAFVFAFFAHLDAFRLFSQLSTDSELRGRLVASAGAMVQKAGEIQGGSGEAGIVPGVYRKTMEDLQKQEAAVQALGAVPQNCTTQAEYETWLRDKLGDKQSADGLVTKYGQLVQAALKTNMDRLADQANQIKGVLSKARIQLFPDPYPDNWRGDNLYGLLTTAGLLSLGAPFWFNALKALSSLRPILASKQEAEQQAG